MIWVEIWMTAIKTIGVGWQNGDCLRKNRPRRGPVLSQYYFVQKVLGPLSPPCHEDGSSYEYSRTTDHDEEVDG